MTLIDPTQQALHAAIQGAGMRHELLASNLANVNTPGYQRRDVDFHAALRGAMAAGEPGAARFDPVTEAGAVTADGNGVDVERESAELSKNALEQQALVTVARVRLEILTLAMGANGA
ncbi:MAG: flagellar basal body protein [Solirubrobacteraceae bacterium]|nr:flagellar basal body protein [Solirubrobacteraceae bacterium]